ncbi:MAG: SDR family oxidoreductase [Candidatus Acidiferrum sp.]
MIAVTGANGHLGQLVIDRLLERVPANQIIATVRSLEKVSRLRTLGVQVREADYSRPETLSTALHGAESVLLISVDGISQRFKLHKAVIDASKESKLELFVYTSLLRADSSEIFLAREHKQTEDYIRSSGLPFVILRNGWYLENHTSALGSAIEHGALLGSSNDGRFASASRADYAAAAAVILTQPVSGSKTYELAGDQSFSMTELASEVSRQIGREIPYRNLSGEEYAAVLRGLGTPQGVIDVIVDADAKAIQGDLDSASRDLGRLIGRPTTTLFDAVASALTARVQRATR